MNKFAVLLNQSTVDNAFIAALVFGGLVGFLQQRSLSAAAVTALSASMLVPAMLLAVSLVVPGAVGLLPPHLLGLSGLMLLIFIIGEFARDASRIDKSELKLRSADRSKLLLSLLASIVLVMIDVILYLGWFHRLVEFNSVPATQQQRLERVRDHPLAPLLRVVFLFVLIVLFIVLTVSGLIGHFSQPPTK